MDVRPGQRASPWQGRAGQRFTSAAPSFIRPAAGGRGAWLAVVSGRGNAAGARQAPCRPIPRPRERLERMGSFAGDGPDEDKRSIPSAPSPRRIPAGTRGRNGRGRRHPRQKSAESRSPQGAGQDAPRPCRPAGSAPRPAKPCTALKESPGRSSSPLAACPQLTAADPGRRPGRISREALRLLQRRGRIVLWRVRSGAGSGRGQPRMA